MKLFYYLLKNVNCEIVHRNTYKGVGKIYGDPTPGFGRKRELFSSVETGGGEDFLCRSKLGGAGAFFNGKSSKYRVPYR